MNRVLLAGATGYLGGNITKELTMSGLEYCIIRPNGFFSDMTEFYTMAEKGRVYLFGDGEFKANPIHGEDLATVCVDAIDKHDQEIKVGGPETLTHNEIAAIAFEILGIKPHNRSRWMHSRWYLIEPGQRHDSKTKPIVIAMANIRFS